MKRTGDFYPPSSVDFLQKVYLVFSSSKLDLQLIERQQRFKTTQISPQLHEKEKIHKRDFFRTKFVFFCHILKRQNLNHIFGSSKTIKSSVCLKYIHLLCRSSVDLWTANANIGPRSAE